MKIEKEVIYSIVTSEGARLEVSEAEIGELFKQLKSIVEPINTAGKYLQVGIMTTTHPPHVTKLDQKVRWPISTGPTATYDQGEY